MSSHDAHLTRVAPPGSEPEPAAAAAKMYGWEMLSFNIHDGFLEAIVRGNRSGHLTAADYNNLCQCETLDDIKMHLTVTATATKHGPYLQNGYQEEGGGAEECWSADGGEELVAILPNHPPLHCQ